MLAYLFFKVKINKDEFIHLPWQKNLLITDVIFIFSVLRESYTQKPRRQERQNSELYQGLGPCLITGLSCQRHSPFLFWGEGLLGPTLGRPCPSVSHRRKAMCSARSCQRMMGPICLKGSPEVKLKNADAWAPPILSELCGGSPGLCTLEKLPHLL